VCVLRFILVHSCRYMDKIVYWLSSSNRKPNNVSVVTLYATEILHYLYEE
jgi:hypothetical protein